MSSVNCNWEGESNYRCASTVLELLQPAAGCCALETVLAMRQPVHGCCWTCSRCAAATLRRYGPSLQVCRAASRSPPAMHRSHCSDRTLCARMAGSCSISSNTTRLTSGDRRTLGGALGERAALGMLIRPIGPPRCDAQLLTKCVWCGAAPRQLLGSTTHSKYPHGGAFRGAVSRKNSRVSVSRCGLIGAACLRRIP